MNSGSATPGGATVPGAGVTDRFIRPYASYTDVTCLNGSDESFTKIQI